MHMSFSLTSFLQCPQTKSKNFELFENYLSFEDGTKYSFVDKIPVMLMPSMINQQEGLSFFENFYQTASEPWKYSQRAAECLRHDYVVEKVAQLTEKLGKKAKILDIGCSLGHITARLHPYAELIVAMDISLTAIQKARYHCLQSAHEKANIYHFVVGSATDLPFIDNFFDIVVASDGLHGWHLPQELQQKAAGEIYRVMYRQAYAIFTDYLHPRLHYKVSSILEKFPWQIECIELLYDRLWYQFESLLKAFKQYWWAQKWLASKKIALFLRSIAKNLGNNYSKHITAIVYKNES